MLDRNEKRKHRRLFFSPENRLEAVFEQSGVTGVILDISRGGMGVSVKRESALKPGKDERMRLSKITGRDGIDIEAGFQVEIRWVLDQPGFHYVAFGCLFMGPSQSFIEAVGAVIDQSLAEGAA